MYHCEFWDWTTGIFNFCSKKCVPEYDVAKLVTRYTFSNKNWESRQTPAHFSAPQLTPPVPDIAERLRQMHAEREEAQRLDRRDKDARNHKNSMNFGRFCQDEPWENINRPPSIQHGFSSSTTASSTGSGREEARAPNLTYTPTSSHLRSVQQQSPRDNFRQQGPPPALPLPHPVTPRPNASHHLTTTAPPRPTPQVSWYFVHDFSTKLSKLESWGASSCQSWRASGRLGYYSCKNFMIWFMVFLWQDIQVRTGPNSADFGEQGPVSICHIDYWSIACRRILWPMSTNFTRIYVIFVRWSKRGVWQILPGLWKT